jgi:hypothetical protein
MTNKFPTPNESEQNLRSTLPSHGAAEIMESAKIDTQ